VNLLFHCIYYPPEVGGLESHVAELARGLVVAGHQVRVVTSRSLPGLAREEVSEGVRIRRTWFPARNPAGWIAHGLGSLAVTRDWARWADVVHAQAFASVFPCRIAARGAGKPLVATFHTSHFLDRARSRRWRPLLSRMVRWSDHALAASREIAQVAMDLSPGTRVEALTNGVDTDRFRPMPPELERPGGERWIMVPRRLFPKNGVEYLIRAMPRVLERVPAARALLVGDGPERARLEALAGELDLGDVVRFLGSREHGDMPAVLCSGELAVFPSLQEATSVAALECMACGLPVVATRVGGLPEIVDEEVGTLVEPGDPDALAQGIVELLVARDLDELGRKARARVVENWSNARLVRRHEEIYRGLLDGMASRDPDRTLGDV